MTCPEALNTSNQYLNILNQLLNQKTLYHTQTNRAMTLNKAQRLLLVTISMWIQHWDTIFAERYQI